ncbi:MAG: RagB/SusD family nutrient uptake outer membrane protein [Chitinophagaceae bacterium]|nr:RagB/SusD family nutrient uptake outer membrane protein [Chitinophagaceae bacterium]
MHYIKSFLKIAPVALLIATVSSCHKIQITPTGTTPPAEAYKTEADIKDLINSGYSPLAGNNFYGGRVQKISEYLADAAEGAGVTGYEGDIFNYKTNPNSGTQDIYKEPYIVILRANTTLENLALVTSGIAARENYEGQAKFLRAVCHFELVKLFAQPYGYSADNGHLGIVIKTKSEFEPGKGRNTVKEVYDVIIADLMAAQELLPAVNSIYPTKWAAKGYLSRVYFQMNKFDSAYKYADQVITGSNATFDNTPNFVTNRFSNPVTSEAVFSLVNESDNTVRFEPLRNNVNPKLGMNLPINLTTYFTGTANAADLRKAWYTDSNGVHGINKYMKPNFILPLLHITELKLIRAESAASSATNLPTAIADINDITNRAYGGAITPLAMNATASQILSRSRQERKLEMIYETGDRLQQIKRIGAKGEPSTSHGNAPWNCNGIVLQFPAQEFNVNVNFLPNPTGGCL